MIKKILILTFVFLGLTACSLDNTDEPNYSFELLPVKTATVPAEFHYGESAIIKVTYDLPTACHFFYGLYYEYQVSSRIVAINSQVINTTSCAEVITEKEYEFDVQVLQHEDYTFKFWKGTDTSGNDIFEEIVVPVVD